MSSIRLSVYAVLALLASGMSLEAAAPLPNDRARTTPIFTFYFENDFFGRTDRHYTNGLKLSWLSADLATWGQTGWRQHFVESLPFVNRPHGQKNFGFALGQSMYTPQDTELTVPDPNDRPYAGWTYVELSFLSKTETILDTLSFQVGMIGRHSYAQDAQRVVHEWLNDSRPNGWEHQLRDELGINVVFERKYRLYTRAFDSTLGLDLIPHIGASLGNVQTYANAGATLRFGINLPSDFGVQLIRPGGGGSSPVDDLDPRVSLRRSWSLFLFAAVDGRAVARDIFLDGNTFRDSPSVKKEPLVSDLSYGVGFVNKRWQLTFTQVMRTREFESQPENHADFGSVTLSRAF